MTDLQKFTRYFRPYRLHVFSGVLFIFAGVVFKLMIPLIFGQAIDALHSGVTWSKLNLYALEVLGVSLISGVFLFLQRRILINMSRHIEYDMRRDFYAHLVDQPLSFFHEHRTGDLMARATNDLAAVRQLAGPMSGHLAPKAFVILSGLLNHQAASVVAAYRARGLVPLRHLKIEGWSSLLLKSLG